MGEQQPFQTLGVFCRQLKEAFGDRVQSDHPELIDQSGWHQSCLRMRLRDNASVDVYEYYWAPLTEGKITLAAVYGWLLRSIMVPYLYVSDVWKMSATERREKKRVRSELLRLVLFFILLLILLGVGIAYLWTGAWLLLQKDPLLQLVQSNFFRAGLGVIHLGALLLGGWVFLRSAAAYACRSVRRPTRPAGFWSWWFLLGLGMVFLGAALYRLWPWYGVTVQGLLYRMALVGAVYLVYRSVRQFMIQYVGDVAIYLSSNALSKYYEVRKAILDGAVQMLESILSFPPAGYTDPDGPQGYDQVLVVAHSLGTVIAYDALNRILVKNRLRARQQGTRQTPLDKVMLFVTMGSPLDKVYYFFRERISEEETERKAIVDSLYPLVRSETPILPCLTWYNYWTPTDPVSGYLDYYPVTDNFIRKDYRIPVAAHVMYWKDPDIYRAVKAFL